MPSPLTCARCHLRQDLCLCEQAPSLSGDCEPLSLILLTHSLEIEKHTNTGRLLEACLSECCLWLWQRTEFERQWAEFTRSSSRVPVLLFPESNSRSENALTVSNMPQSPPPLEQITFVLIDATWQQARKMLRQSPSLRDCQRLSLQSSAPSRYHLRKHQQQGNLSTVETGCELLKWLGLERDAELIERYFGRFLQHSEANRSGYDLKGN